MDWECVDVAAMAEARGAIDSVVESPIFTKLDKNQFGNGLLRNARDELVGQQ